VRKSVTGVGELVDLCRLLGVWRGVGSRRHQVATEELVPGQPSCSATTKLIAIKQLITFSNQNSHGWGDGLAANLPSQSPDRDSAGDATGTRHCFADEFFVWHEFWTVTLS